MKKELAGQTGLNFTLLESDEEEALLELEAELADELLLADEEDPELDPELLDPTMGAETVVVVVTVMVVVWAATHLPAFRISPSLLEQVLQATPPSL